MKKNKNILYLPMALTMLLLLSLSSCGLIFDDCPECYEAETGTLILSLKSRGADTRAGNPFTSTDDDGIAQARVIIFNDAHEVEHNAVYTHTDLIPENDAIRIQLEVGEKSVYVIANESGTIAGQLAAINSVTQLEQLMANEIGAALSFPFLMAGKLEGIVLATGLINHSVTLTRAAAKINIQLKKGVSDDVMISKIRLLKNTKKTTLWENAGVAFAQDYWTYEEGVSLTLSDSSWTTDHTLYVYENLGNSDTNKSNATQLEIEGTFNGLPTTYRVYVNEDVTDTNPAPGDPGSSVTTPDDHFYNIKRNHVYNITGTISGIGQFDGITIFTEVEEWVPVEKDYFVGYGYTVVVDGKKVTISNHDEDCAPHTVKLEGTFDDNDTEKIFDQTGANDTVTYNLKDEPEGEYLKVYYNDVLVHTFTK